MADRFSGWPTVAPLRKLHTKAITSILDDWLIDDCKPIKLRSDGGPQFRTEFDNCCKEQDIVHELSSPYHHESNGHAEVTVKEMKKLLAKTGGNWHKFRLALREYRNTPRYDGLSPAQWRTGYRQRTNAIATPNAYRRITDEQIISHLARRGCEQTKVKEREDKSKRELQKFAPNDQVWVQDPMTKKWSIEATIVHARSERSYLVTDRSKEFLRNRRFLRPRVGPSTNLQIEPRVSSETTQSPHRRRRLRSRKGKDT